MQMLQLFLHSSTAEIFISISECLLLPWKLDKVITDSSVHMSKVIQSTLVFEKMWGLRLVSLFF